MTSLLKKYLVIAAGILLALFLFQKFHWLPSFSNFFKSKPLIIDDTPILIKEINNLAQLITISSFDEVVMDSVKQIKKLPGDFFPHPPSKIILIAKGEVLAGVDFKKLENEDILIKKDSVSIMLPQPQILQIILNPSSFETFDENGNWNSEEILQLKIRMRNKIIKRALEQNLLTKAGERCKMIMENFLTNAGFKKIEILFKGQSL